MMRMYAFGDNVLRTFNHMFGMYDDIYRVQISNIV